MEDFLSTLTAAERKFVQRYRLQTLDESGDVRFSSAYQRKLTQRVLENLQRYMYGE